MDKRQLCDIQGRLFELSLKKGLDSPSFIESFMNSNTAFHMDGLFDHLQWAGEAYILDELNDEVHGLKKAGKLYPNEAMYWIGYIYRYWHYYTGEFSHEIFKIADTKTMITSYLGFHTLSLEMAIDRLKEIYEEKHLKE